MSQRFDYTAYTAQGQAVSGSIEADSKQHALRDLIRQNLTPLDIKEPQAVQVGRLRRLNDQDMLTALYELSAMLLAGVGIADAVESQSQSAAHPAMRVAFTQMLKTLRHGGGFAQALEDTQLRLPKYVNYLVRAGELSGTLAEALRDSCEQFEYDLQIKAQARGALIYPSILVLTGILAVLMMFMFVVPSFVNLLDQPKSLPWLAWAVLSAGRWANNHQLIVVLLVGTSIVVPIVLLRIQRVRTALLNRMEVVPIIGEWLIQSDIAAWARVMSALTKNSVELTAALELAGSVVRLPRRQHRLQCARQAVIQGDTLSVALQTHECLNDTGYNLVRVGEKTGSLDAMLLTLSLLYSKQSQQRLQKALMLIEPVAILVIGSAIGTLIIAIILAITSANEIAF